MRSASLFNALRSAHQTPSQWLHWLVFLLLGTLLFLAPLVRGGNREIALSVLLVPGLLILALLLAHSCHQGLPRSSAPRWWWLAAGLLIFSPFWLGLVQLVPIGSQWWSQLAGREPYLPALQALHGNTPARLPLSLHPSATWAAMWSAVPVSAAFAAALVISKAQARQLLALLLVAATLQVAMAVAQFAQGPASPLFFESQAHRVIGTFAHYNHLANFLAMLVPVCFFLLVHPPHAQRHAPPSRLSPAVRNASLGLLGFALLLIILTSTSRGGTLAASAVLALSVTVFVLSHRRKLRLVHWLGIAALGLFIAVAVLTSADLQTLGARLEGQRLRSDAQIRNEYALATLQAAQALWPWGSGMGTFESVFPRFQPSYVVGYINHAHNDYPQLLMELGAAALLLGAAFLALVVWQLRHLGQAWRQAGHLSTEVALRFYAGIGGLALLLHSWVEYNMHIPALAITAAFLLGTFLRPHPHHPRGHSN